MKVGIVGNKKIFQRRKFRYEGRLLQVKDDLIIKQLSSLHESCISFKNVDNLVRTQFEMFKTMVRENIQLCDVIYEPIKIAKKRAQKMEKQNKSFFQKSRKNLQRKRRKRITGLFDKDTAENFNTKRERKLSKKRKIFYEIYEDALKLKDVYVLQDSQFIQAIEARSTHMHENFGVPIGED